MLTSEQLDVLRSVPLGGMPNKLRLAFTLSKRKQVEAVESTGILAPNLSDLVRGDYKSLTVETARKLAEFFGCAIEDLFPGKSNSSHASQSDALADPNPVTTRDLSEVP